MVAGRSARGSTPLRCAGPAVAKSSLRSSDLCRPRTPVIGPGGVQLDLVAGQFLMTERRARAAAFLEADQQHRYAVANGHLGQSGTDRRLADPAFAGNDQDRALGAEVSYVHTNSYPTGLHPTGRRIRTTQSIRGGPSV